MNPLLNSLWPGAFSFSWEQYETAKSFSTSGAEWCKTCYSVRMTYQQRDSLQTLQWSFQDVEAGTCRSLKLNRGTRRDFHLPMGNQSSCLMHAPLQAREERRSSSLSTKAQKSAAAKPTIAKSPPKHQDCIPNSHHKRVL